jgi:hypothetical protein
MLGDVRFQITGAGAPEALDNANRSNQNRPMSETSELSRKKRRRRPLREVAHTARWARLALEREIYREPLVRQLLRFTPAQLARIDEERRVVDCRGIRPRAVLIRELLDEVLSFRQAMRPRSSGPGRRGAPFEIDIV